MPITAGNLEHAELIAEASGAIFNPKCDRVISRTDSVGKLLGGVIFQGYRRASIGIHVAGFDKHWINNDMLWITFNYPFEQLKVTKLMAQVPSGNLKALDFDLKLGFKEEVRLRDIYPDEDLIILSMRREDCRWLKLKPRGPSYGR
ncbi:GNAT family N-acetyltransferase [Bradyrhizobium cenepequi]